MNYFASDLKLIGDFYSPDGATICGHLTGSLLLQGTLKIEAEGKVQGGAVEATGLTIQPGGQLKGQLSIGKKAGSMAPTPASNGTTNSLVKGLTKFALGQ